jgi:hypothetical protein
LNSVLHLTSKINQVDDNSKDLFQEFADYLSTPKMLPMERIEPKTNLDFLDDLDSTILSLEKLNIEVPIKKKKDPTLLKVK